MEIAFTKMNGAGNDFALIDNRDGSLNLSAEQIARLCDRHRGIGADGLLLVEQPKTKEADFLFRYYNADGGEAEMCGNGARCYGKFVASLLSEPCSEVRFETLAGILTAYFLEDGDVRIAMSEPFDLQTDLPLEIEGLASPVHFINSGVPHAVSFVENTEEVDIVRFGRAIREHAHFSPSGTNVNFAEVLSEGHLRIRTYERGVEDETLACGTGMVACALLYHHLKQVLDPIKVDVQGGDTLEIGFESEDGRSFENVTLTGPADFVFKGAVNLCS